MKNKIKLKTLEILFSNFDYYEYQQIYQNPSIIKEVRLHN